MKGELDGTPNETRRNSQEAVWEWGEWWHASKECNNSEGWNNLASNAVERLAKNLWTIDWIWPAVSWWVTSAGTALAHLLWEQERCDGKKGWAIPWRSPFQKTGWDSSFIESLNRGRVLIDCFACFKRRRLEQEYNLWRNNPVDKEMAKI